MTSFYEELHPKSSLSDEKENIQSRASVDKWIFRLLLILIGMTPLIVMANIEEVISPLISNTSILVSGMKGELFTHFKALFSTVITLIIGALFLAKVFLMGGSIRKSIMNYPLIIFAVVLVISTIASPNISIALNGVYNRSDGAVSWLCYIALMFIAMNIEYPKKALNHVLYSLYPFVIINLFIVAMNFYDRDLLQYKWIKSFVSMTLPEGGAISEGSQLVGTLNQWNYMSGMFAIMTVLFLTIAILEKNMPKSLGHLIISVISITVMFMSISTSGFLTVSISLPVVLFIAFKSEEKMRSFTLIAIFLIAIIPIFHVLASKDSRVWVESIGFIVKQNPYEEEVVNTSSESNNKQIEWMQKVYAAKEFELPVLPERGVSFGSGRGYIWNETLQLVKERPLLGYGNDTLVYNFPHYKLESRAGLWDENTIVDKPHNVYLGVLYGNGIIGFSALMMIIVISLVVFFINLLQSKQSNIPVYVLGVAITAYSIQAMFNDSLPGITVVAFIFIGMMISMQKSEWVN